MDVARGMAVEGRAEGKTVEDGGEWMWREAWRWRIWHEGTVAVEKGDVGDGKGLWWCMAAMGCRHHGTVGWA